MNSTSYETIASEYYDERHITSRSFDRSTQEFCNSFRFELPQNGLVLELGCGIGRTNKYCKIKDSRIIQTDISLSMLRLSPREMHLEQCCCNAIVLPFRDNAFSIVTAFLYDPFNFQNLYHEIYRILEFGGAFVGTLPHISWGDALRTTIGYDNKKTVFFTKEDKKIEIDSILMNDFEIQNSLHNASLTPIHLQDLFLPKDGFPLSPFIEIPASKLGINPYKLPIVKFIIARKEE